MAGERKLTPVQYLAQYSEGAAGAFQSLRKAVLETPDRWITTPAS